MRFNVVVERVIRAAWSMACASIRVMTSLVHVCIGSEISAEESIVVVSITCGYDDLSSCSSKT